MPARIRHGRAARLVLRVLAAGLAAALTVISGAGMPAVAAVLIGIGLWLVLMSRGDLAPPPSR